MSEKSREYYATHCDRRRASARASYAKHRAERLAKRKAYYRANRVRCLEWWRQYRKRPEVQAYRYAWSQMYYAENGDRIRARQREYHRKYPLMRAARYAEMCEHFKNSAAAYAEHRRQGRIWLAKKAISKGRIYKPRFDLRIPDYCVKGQVLDVRSPWLIENLTPSQRAFARELAIERKEWRDR